MNKSFKVCYETHGDKKNPCIIFIPGISGQLIHWPPNMIQGLVDQGYYIVTFDNRDSGLSYYYDEFGSPNINELIEAKQKGEAVTVPYTLEDMAADVISLMDHLDVEKAHIAGISMGGIIAQLVALGYSDRVICLICIASTSSDPRLPPAKQEVLDFFFAPKPENETEESFLKGRLALYQIYNHPDYFDEEKVRELYTRTYHRAHSSEGFKRQLVAMMATESRFEKLRELSMKALIIHGDWDSVFSIEHGEQLAELIPNAHLEIVHKMGHGIPDGLGDQLVKVIASFLE